MIGLRTVSYTHLDVYKRQGQRYASNMRYRTIKAELKQKVFKILTIENKLKRIKENSQYKYIRLPLFILTFGNSEDIKIHEIHELANMKVRTEMFKTGKLIPQCKRCQRYGHTQKFCQHNPVCVKFAGDHLTATCTKSRNTSKVLKLC